MHRICAIFIIADPSKVILIYELKIFMFFSKQM